MKTWEAIKALQEGKKIRQTDWYNEDRYICLQHDDHGYIMDQNGDIYIFAYLDDREWETYDRKFPLERSHSNL